MSDKVLIRNAAKCLGCGEVIESKSRHDFRVCICGRLAVDGGLDYVRRLGYHEELSEYASTHAIFVLMRPDGACLVEFRTWCNDWVMPGGAVEEGEYPITAACREAEEELGIKITGEATELWIPITKTNGGSVIKAFLFTEWEGQIPDVDFDNQAPLGWLTPEELIEHDLESQRFIAQAILRVRNANSAYEVHA